MAVLAEALRRRGDVGRAHSVATAGLAATREAGYRFGMGLALRTLGQIADTSGDRDQAAAFLVAAIETFQSMPARLDLARTRRLLGELYLRDGDTRGADLVEEATRELDALGLPA